jgi:hypothetical protein
MFQKLGPKVAVDHATYHEVLLACQELKLWETAVDLLAEMEKTGASYFHHPSPSAFSVWQMRLEVWLDDPRTTSCVS